nr:aldehyde dehydrogenase family protein [uncultured Bartonella sp.]
MAAWKIGPALAAGCSIVLKPAQETTLSTLKLAEIAHEAGHSCRCSQYCTGIGTRCR